MKINPYLISHIMIDIESLILEGLVQHHHMIALPQLMKRRAIHPEKHIPILILH